MDFLRSCYKTKWRFFERSGTFGESPISDVEWYLCEQEAKALPFAHCWGSTNWLDEWQKCDCPVGEIPFAPNHRWAKGIAPFGARGLHFCGKREDFQTPKVWSPDLPGLARLPSGLSVCCVPELARALGLLSVIPADGGIGMRSVEITDGAIVMEGEKPKDRLSLVYLASVLDFSGRIVRGGFELPAGGLSLADVMENQAGELGLASLAADVPGGLVLASEVIPDGGVVLSGEADDVMIFDDPGDYVYVIPLDAVEVDIYAIGGGGAGSLGYGDPWVNCTCEVNGGGGGGGGWWLMPSYPVTGGGVLLIRVGAGGVGQSSPFLGDGQDGGVSYVNDGTMDIVVADGGLGGGNGPPDSASNGGYGSGVTGSMGNMGGNGGMSFGGEFSVFPVGGSGGGGAGSDGGAGFAGGDAVGFAAGTAGGSVTGGVGGQGGDWVDPVAENGGPATNPGGGGGGGASSDGSSPGGNGGPGGNGKVVIVWR